VEAEQYVSAAVQNVLLQQASPSPPQAAPPLPHVPPEHRPRPPGQLSLAAVQKPPTQQPLLLHALPAQQT
jgi:hypothetical protein